MAKIPKRWYWLVPRAQFDLISSWATLDILRYDGALVLHNPPDGFYLFEADADRHPHGPNEARLASFGIQPTWVSSRPMTYDQATAEARAIADSQNRKG